MKVPLAAASTAGDASDEISALVLNLQATQRRIEELAGIEVDAVLLPGGQFFLLQDAREKLRRSEERFRNMFTAAATGIAGSTPDGRFLYANNAYCQMLGYTENELRELTFAALTHPDDLTLNLKMRDEVLAGERNGFHMEKRYLKKDGTIVWTRHSVSPTYSASGKEVESFVVVAEDITEHKTIADALKTSEAEFRALAEAVPQIVWATRPDGWTTYFNDHWMRYTGLTWEESLGHGWNKPFHPDDRQSAWDAWQRAITGRAKYSLECRLRRADGAYRWWLIRGVEMRDNAGNILKWFGTCTDIHDLKIADLENIRMKRALKMLSSSNQCLVRSLGETDLLQDFCKIAVEVGGYRMAWVGFAQNDEYRTITPMAYSGLEDGFLTQSRPSWSERESLGIGPSGQAIRSGKMVICEDLANEPTYADLLQAAQKRGYRSGMFLPLLDANKAFGVMVLYSQEAVRPSVDEIAVLREMADDLAFGIIHHRNEVAREKTEARFRRVVESNSQGMFFWKETGEIIDANDAFLKLTGYTRKDLNMGKLDWKAMTPPEFEELTRNFSAKLVTEGLADPITKEYFGKDGTRIPVLVCIAGFNDNFDEGVSFVIDLTEQKKIEKQLLRTQRLESIGTLASGIAHDLNNVLAPIMMSVALLHKNLPPGDDGSRKLLAILEDNARRGANLTRQVLGFARGFEGERILIDPMHLVREIEQVIRETFPKSIEFRCESARGISTILADSTQLHQILLNLAVNARDAMPAGGRLSIKVENATVNEAFALEHVGAKAGQYVLLNVTDTGTGISREIQERMFEPFFSTKPMSQGTGLGLSTVLSLVKSHGGFLVLKSEVGRGSSFMVYIPATVEPVGQKGNDTGYIGLKRGNNQLILLVDDEDPIRIIATAILERHGYRVLQGKNGVEALSLYAIQREDIAVVITDMAMPVMDGHKTIEALRQMNPEVRIISSSGVGSFATDSAGRPFGSDKEYFVQKPYTAETLLTAISNVLAGKGSSKAQA